MKICPFCAATLDDLNFYCPQCGKEYTDDDLAGPSKGADFQISTGQVLAVCLTAALVFTCVGYQKVNPGAEPATPPPPPREKSFGDVAYACEYFIKERLVSPKSADFARLREDQVSGPLGGVWTYRSSVAAENAFGAALRHNFTCQVQFDSEGAELVALDLKGR